MNILEWDVEELRLAMRLPSDEDVIAFFKDGRRSGFLVEHRIAHHLGWDLAKSEGCDHDIVSPSKGRYEVRCLTDRGLFLCPSNMVGAGRSFNEDGFLAKLDSIDGYIIADVSQFPRVPFRFIDSQTVRDWWNYGWLGKTTRLSRPAMLSLYRQVRLPL